MKEKFINKQVGDWNKDSVIFNDPKASLDYYLSVVGDFKSSFPDMVSFRDHSVTKGFEIIDESRACPVGFKARAGELLVKTLKDQGFNEIVYVQPRRGFAGISLSYLCKKYDMNLTLVMPASKKASPHQLYCIELGAKPLFLRVAAMKNANLKAAEYAARQGLRCYFVPLGLQHPLVTAMAVKEIWRFFDGKEKPWTMWSVISTGVLSRALQIALPDTDHIAVAVSRNIQKGELGGAKFYSYHKGFTAKSDLIPTTFDCEPHYDAKGYHYMTKYGDWGDWFFSVAGKAPEPTISPEEVDSYRDWGDNKDFNF